MSTKTKGRKRTPTLPGMEIPKPKNHKALEEAALDYEEVRNKRMKLTEQETEKQAVLQDAMRKAGVKSYQFDDVTVTMLEKIRAKVSRNGDAEDGDPEESLVERGRRHLEGPAGDVVNKTAEGLKG